MTHHCLLEIDFNLSLRGLVIHPKIVATFIQYPHTDKNRKKIMRKFPNFLKMRIFLSKWTNYLPILTGILSFWENWILILRKLGIIFCLFLQIFLRFLSVQLISEAFTTIYSIFCDNSYSLKIISMLANTLL